MRTTIFMVILSLLLCNASYCQTNNDYKVGMGDILDIVVVEHDELNRVVTVAPDGTISFPLIGTVEVKDKKISEINTIIEDKLRDGYVKYPQVNTSLKDAKSKNFYIYGEVNNPGSYQFSDEMTVLKAITLAGGLTKFGSESNIKILRNTSDKKEYETIRVNLKNVTVKGDKSKDVAIEAGDVIVISE